MLLQGVMIYCCMVCTVICTAAAQHLQFLPCQPAKVDLRLPVCTQQHVSLKELAILTLTSQF